MNENIKLNYEFNLIEKNTSLNIKNIIKEIYKIDF